jgi:hypothetical protein
MLNPAKENTNPPVQRIARISAVRPRRRTVTPVWRMFFLLEGFVFTDTQWGFLE